MSGAEWADLTLLGIGVALGWVLAATWHTRDRWRG